MEKPSQRNPVAGQSCRYCGDPATDIDHVPPTSLLKRWRLPWAQQTVPACDFCNRTLSNRAALMTMPARKSWIKASIWRKRLVHRRREKMFHVEAFRVLGNQAARQGGGGRDGEADSDEAV